MGRSFFYAIIPSTKLAPSRANTRYQTLIADALKAETNNADIDANQQTILPAHYPPVALAAAGG
jgi:hypothetical protein